MCVVIAIICIMKITSPIQVFKWITPKISKQVEEVWVLALNASCQIIKGQMIHRGTVNYCLMHPRDIFRFVICQNASSFILVHNHPSGNLDPSKEDIEMTQRLLLVSKLVEIPLIDHLIVTDKSFISLQETKRILFI